MPTSDYVLHAEIPYLVHSTIATVYAPFLGKTRENIVTVNCSPAKTFDKMEALLQTSLMSLSSDPGRSNDK
jgi:hypothetical protein